MTNTAQSTYKSNFYYKRDQNIYKISFFFYHFWINKRDLIIYYFLIIWEENPSPSPETLKKWGSYKIWDEILHKEVKKLLKPGPKFLTLRR